MKYVDIERGIYPGHRKYVVYDIVMDQSSLDDLYVQFYRISDGMPFVMTLEVDTRGVIGVCRVFGSNDDCFRFVDIFGSDKISEIYYNIKESI